MGDFIDDNAGWVIAILIGIMILGVIATGKEQQRNHEKFMAACLQDKKQYECDVMWGQTRESKASTELAQSIAIGAAAGAVAGSAGRR